RAQQREDAINGAERGRLHFRREAGTEHVDAVRLNQLLERRHDGTLELRVGALELDLEVVLKHRDELPVGTDGGGIAECGNQLLEAGVTHVGERSASGAGIDARRARKAHDSCLGHPVARMERDNVADAGAMEALVALLHDDLADVWVAASAQLKWSDG